MKPLISLTVVLASMFISVAHGCDEACLKEKAQAVNNKKFPSYLSWRHCEDTRMEFMTSAVRSLGKYRNTSVNTRYKGPLKNIKQYVSSRKEWLTECDDYMRLTERGRIFEDDETTENIFKAIDFVTQELQDLIAGVTYSSNTGGATGEELARKFDSLLDTVDDHKTLMHLKGRYVYR